MIYDDEFYMNLALEQAKKAYYLDEVPVGAIIVHKNEIIASTFNNRESTQNPVGHAELLAIMQASKILNSWRLIDCTLYVSLEPCLMCTGAIVLSRIKRLVFATKDPKAGAICSAFHIFDLHKLNHIPKIEHGILAKEGSDLLKEFFKQKRLKNKSQKNKV